MIAPALRLLRDELSQYVMAHLHTGDTLTDADIKLENIAALESDSNGDLDNCLILTLVNTEEESSLKNSSHYTRVSGRIRFQEPPVYLNLYLLITTTLDKSQMDAYEIALYRMSSVIQFFQSKKCFTVQNSPFSSVATDNTIDIGDREELRLNVEMYSLTFEQINHLWGSLGGKQVPFVMYKIRLVKLQDDTNLDAPVIEEIDNNFQATLES